MKDKAYEIPRNPKYNGHQRGLESMVYNFFDKKIGSGASLNEELAQELHRPVIKNFKRRKVYARFKYNIWAADLAEMGSLSFKNRSVKYLICVIDVFVKYTWVKPLKHEIAKTVLHGFVEVVNKSNRKPNISWVDQGKEFYNSFIQKWLDDNDILMHSTQ